MTFSKLATAASLLVFTGLVAWGVGGSAAQTPAQRLKNPDRRLLQLPSRAGHAAALAGQQRRARKAAAQADDRGDAADPAIPDDLPPVVLSVEPKVGAVDVDPDVKEIRVTFSKKMTDKSWSWPTGNKYAAPKVEGGTIHFERDGAHASCP